MIWRDQPVCGIDCETTGRDPWRDRVVSLAVVVLKQEAGGDLVLRRHKWLLNPERAIPADVTAVHGITDEMVKGAPTFRDILVDFAQATHGAIPCAYNEGFDRAFVASEWLRAERDTRMAVPIMLGRDARWLDPLVWSRHFHRYQRGTGVHKLMTVARRFELVGATDDGAHTADFDAELAVRVLFAFACRRFEATPQEIPETLGSALEVQDALYHEDRGRLLWHFLDKRMDEGKPATCWLADWGTDLDQMNDGGGE
jgi:DNA polymerase-3 subunit epsilon